MKHLFIPYNLALLAKQKNFNEPVIALYDEFIEIDQERVLMSAVNEMGILTGIKSLSLAYSIGVPSYQQLLDWFREKHNLLIIPNTADNKGNWSWIISSVVLSIGSPYDWDSNETYPSYYEALNNALEEAFKLI